MTIEKIAVVRTGLVTARKKKGNIYSETFEYRLLNLRCISDEGLIEKKYLEPFVTSEELKEDYLTQMGDILIRLSSPYTAVIIDREEFCGLVVPSHFAIIRADRKTVLPEYLFWSLWRDKNRITLMQNSSGSTAFGTISAGLIGSLPIKVLPLRDQKILGELYVLGKREQEILQRLAEEKKVYGTLLLNQAYEKIKNNNR